MAEVKKNAQTVTDIASHNAGLIKAIKKLDGNITNKQILETIKLKLQIPEFPFGYTAQLFDEAQTYIRTFLKENGIVDADGFTTGSRLLGITSNPTKADFGIIKKSFDGVDLDIIIITYEKQLSNNQIKKLMEGFKQKFNHPLGVRYLYGNEQLKYLPIY